MSAEHVLMSGSAQLPDNFPMEIQTAKHQKDLKLFWETYFVLLPKMLDQQSRNAYWLM